MFKLRLFEEEKHKILGLALLIVALLSLVGAEQCRAGTIYYYEDENGVLHFTDVPNSKQYRPFFSFGENLNVDRSRVLDLIEKYSRVHGVDAQLVEAIVEVESGFKHEAQSSAGAQGLMQIMPETQKDLQINRPFDPEVNIEAGIRYFRALLDRFDNLPLALAAYNAGPKRVEQYSGIPPYPETKRYVQKVVRLYKKLKKTEFE